MSNNKLSSVEWLWDKFVNKPLKISDLVKLLEQAKAMHRKEILEARQNGLDNGFVNGSWDSQLYYELEFGGNNE